MIASHNTYTYQKTKNFLINLFHFWWRCQKKTDNEQYELGVKIFDVRIFRNNQTNTWGTAHGFAHFEKDFKHIWDICEYFKKNMPGSYVRIILEDNVKNKNEEILDIFVRESKKTFTEYSDMIWEIGTHHPWKIYFSGEHNWNIIEYYCHLLNWNTDQSFIYNIKHLDLSSLSLPWFSKRHNPNITQHMIDDPYTVHIIDYIGVYPKPQK